MIRILVSALLVPLLVGCKPGSIGVQDYGSIVGRVYDAKTSQALNDVVISVGSLLVVHSSPDGTFSFTQVPAGDQSIIVHAPGGYLPPPPVQVSVQKNQTTAAPAIGLNPASR